MATQAQMSVLVALPWKANTIPQTTAVRAMAQSTRALTTGERPSAFLAPRDRGRHRARVPVEGEVDGQAHQVGRAAVAGFEVGPVGGRDVGRSGRLSQPQAQLEPSGFYLRSGTCIGHTRMIACVRTPLQGDDVIIDKPQPTSATVIGLRQNVIDLYKSIFDDDVPVPDFRTTLDDLLEAADQVGY